MSTKILESALRMLEAYATLTPDVANDARSLVADARIELAALRAAAKHISEGEGDEALRDCADDYSAERSLFDAIAQEGT